MNKKKPTIFTSILWFVIAGIWAVNLWISLFYNESSIVLVILQAVCVLSSLSSAVLHLIRYKSENRDERVQR